MGFEPTLEFPLNTLSKRAPSTTRPSLLGVVYLFEFNTPRQFMTVPLMGESRFGWAGDLTADETVYSVTLPVL